MATLHVGNDEYLRLKHRQITVLERVSNLGLRRVRIIGDGLDASSSHPLRKKKGGLSASFVHVGRGRLLLRCRPVEGGQAVLFLLNHLEDREQRTVGILAAVTIL